MVNLQVWWNFDFWSSSPVHLLPSTFQSPLGAAPGVLSRIHSGIGSVQCAYPIFPGTLPIEVQCSSLFPFL